MLGCHEDTLRRAVAEGRIEAVRLRERGWLRFRTSDLARLVGGPIAAEREARIVALETRLAAEQRSLALDRLTKVGEDE